MITTTERNKLVLEHRDRAVASAAYVRRYAPGVDRRDLEAAGNLALVCALDQYDPQRNPNLKGHLSVKVRCLIVDQLRASKDLLRGQREYPVFVDVTAIQGVRSDLPDPFETTAASERAARLKAALVRLPKRLRSVIRLLYWDGLRGDEAAKRLGVCETRVYQLRAAALGKLREQMGVVTR